MAKFKAAGVETRLLVMPGKDHRWKAEPSEVQTVGEWFDKHLLGDPLMCRCQPPCNPLS